MRGGARHATYPIALLFVLLIVLASATGLPGRASAQSDSGFEGLPDRIATRSTTSFDFRFVPAVDGLFSEDLSIEIEGTTVRSGMGAHGVSIGGAASINVEVRSTAANLYEISLTVPPDFLARLVEAGQAPGGQYVLAFFVATDTGVEMFDFRTPADAPERITVVQGPGAPPLPPGPPPPDPPPGGEMGLPSAGNGGLADPGLGITPIVWLGLLTVALAGLALSGVRLSRRAR